MRRRQVLSLVMEGDTSKGTHIGTRADVSSFHFLIEIREVSTWYILHP